MLVTVYIKTTKYQCMLFMSEYVKKIHNISVFYNNFSTTIQNFLNRSQGIINDVDTSLYFKIKLFLYEN